MITVYKKWLYVDEGDVLVLDNNNVAIVKDTEFQKEGLVKVTIQLVNGQRMEFVTKQETMIPVRIQLYSVKNGSNSK